LWDGAADDTDADGGCLMGSDSDDEAKDRIPQKKNSEGLPRGEKRLRRT
jgi:hypothetical protein